MPSVRFSRDKRGYEYVFLVHTPMRRGKAGRTRVLYWYRTPPGVRIGRRPFDEEVQRTLERQNPGVSFDWEAIIATPMPPPDMTEFWRERRRAEKAARQERRATEADAVASPGEVPEPGGDATAVLEAEAPAEVALDAAALAVEQTAAAGDTTGTEVEDGSPRKRRRRRGGRRRVSSEPPSETALPSSEGVPSGDTDDPTTD